MTVHVIGAGLAGLSAALALAEAGRSVVLYEAGPQAGGRCRSYFDRELGCRIDNGNHLLLSGNHAAHDYLRRIGASGTLTGPGMPLFPFFDRATGARWALRPGARRLSLWIFDRDRRVPGTRARDYLALLRPDRPGTVAESWSRSPLYARLLEPLAVSALNTRPEQGANALFATIIRETLLRGGAACVPAFPKEGLSETLVDPALARLQELGAAVHVGRRIPGLTIAGGRVTALGADPIGAADQVVLAVPPWVAADLLPGLTVPDQHEAILNLHFRADPPEGAWRRAGFIGLVGGTAEWIFAKPGVISVTISAASRLLERADIAALAWGDIQAATGLSHPMPPVRVLKEKRATFAATAAQNARRPGVRTTLSNLVLAGDWTATNLPATIEGAIRSGFAAAKNLLTDAA